jgi:hypothetical protein
MFACLIEGPTAPAPDVRHKASLVGLAIFLLVFVSTPLPYPLRRRCSAAGQQSRVCYLAAAPGHLPLQRQHHRMGPRYVFVGNNLPLTCVAAR